MRETPLPLLRDLKSGHVVNRCSFCRELVFLHEGCKDKSEAKRCPPRGMIEATEDDYGSVHAAMARSRAR
jgi:hypothetical protein